MNAKEFKSYLKRDNGRCYHCGKAGDDLIPQHRVGRGMGGSKSAARNSPSNIITFCSYANGLLESDASFARLGASRGWKLASWQLSDAEPVYDASTGSWWLLDNDLGRREIPKGAQIYFQKNGDFFS